MEDRILKFIGLARKAGKLACGEMNACSAIKTGKAVLTLVAADASDNAIKRLDDLLKARSFKIMTLPYTKDQLAQSLGTGLCAMIAVTDAGFASQIAKLVSTVHSESQECKPC